MAFDLAAKPHGFVSGQSFPAFVREFEMSTAEASAPAEQRVLLGNVSWATYLTLLEDTENPRGRMAYDAGALEIMSPSVHHESVKRLIGRFIETYTLEAEIEVRSVGAATFKRKDLLKGVEADECYYIQDVEAVQGIDKIDLLIYPPPNLAVEVDISRSSTIKLGIYEALGLGEVWHYDGETIHVHVLYEGHYLEKQESSALPGFPLEYARQLLQQRHSLGETQLVRQFQTHIRN
jgi:Uma2 family endonuclease